MDLTQIKGKTVVIIGASRGIGLETARSLHGKGVNLVLGSRHIEGLEQEFHGNEVYPLFVDVTDEESVKKFTESSIERFGKIDVLINAAGVGKFSNLLDSDTRDFDHMIAVNLRGTYLTCKYFGRHMVKRNKGQIINLVSIAGTTALAGCGGYSASKFGVLGLTRVLQAELRGKGLRITSVIPGAVNTSFWDSIDTKPDASSMIPVQAIAEHIIFLLCQPDSYVIDEITIMPQKGIL